MVLNELILMIMVMIMLMLMYLWLDECFVEGSIVINLFDMCKYILILSMYRVNRIILKSR